ncbi:MAG TPA: hypothetical protein VFC48_01320, partial [Cellulomonas sp.]|nr:hypothetical protein [Cellulomonas sp.]
MEDQVHERMQRSGIPGPPRHPDEAELAADLPASSLDLVLECTGHESRVIAAAGSLREGGELSLVGVPWRPRDAGALHP